MKTKIIIAIVALLVIIGGVFAYFNLNNQNITAYVMRIEQIIGDVTLLDENKNKIDLTTSDFRLQSGHILETNIESIAQISLDDYKSIRLDELSQCEFKSDGKMINLMLNSGSLFFNVTKPLEDDEVMKIHTANMITGIRGTSGYVYAETHDIAYFTLLTGEVEVETTDNSESIILSAGQTAKVTTDNDVQHIEVIEIEEIPDFVVAYAKDDDDYLDEVKQATGIDLNQVNDDENDDDIDDDTDDENDDNDDENDTDNDEDDDDNSDDNDIDDDIDENDDNDDDSNDDDNDVDVDDNDDNDEQDEIDNDDTDVDEVESNDAESEEDNESPELEVQEPEIEQPDEEPEIDESESVEPVEPEQDEETPDFEEEHSEVNSSDNDEESESEDEEESD